MPMAFQLGIVCLVAAIVAGQINRAIYRLAWNKRDIGPWSNPVAGVPDRRWFDKLPVLGWIWLSRESNVHGVGYWHRPFLIEIGFVLASAFLYLFEHNRGIYPVGAVPVSPEIVLQQFAAHFVLFALMTAATFIDIDEKTIPDEITVPGTLFGFVWATLFPASLLPVWDTFAEPPIRTSTMTLSSPFAWPEILNGERGLLIGLFCVTAWIYALLPKTLWYRSGFVRFVRYLLASIVRHPYSRWYAIGWVVLCGLVATVWSYGGMAWQSLLTSLVGMAGGGAIVWIIRAVARPILGQEAMGFGDVTLMGMIGSFVGWQAAIIVFLMAPFTGSIIAVLQWIVTRRKDIPFGPFLCSSAVATIVAWPEVWTRCEPVLHLGGIVPIALAVGLVALAVSLLIVRGVKTLFTHG